MRIFLAIILAGLAAASAAGEKKDASSPSSRHELEARLTIYEGEGGTTCSDFLAEILPWERKGGDWKDAHGKLFGDQPYDAAAPGPMGAAWDVTPLVKKWTEAGNRQGIFLIRPVSGSGYATFRSREAARVSDWPMLVLDYADGRRDMLKPSADTHLDCSTYRSLGRADTLMLSNQTSALLQFALPPAAEKSNPVRARLVLSSAGASSGSLRLGIFEAAIPTLPTGPIRQGLAAGFVADQGIDKHPDVIFATGFEEGTGWKSRWARGAGGEIDLVTDDRLLRFAALSGAALRVNLKKGSNYGADVRLNLRDAGGEPDELYFRYYLRLAEDWDPTKDGGKMPGIAGTYNTAGWGGRPSDGTNGWSTRGGFLRAFEQGHPLRGLTQLTTYAYHADMGKGFGDTWIWPGVLLERNRWYCIEQQVTLNSPSTNNGSMRVWVDGRLVMERTKLRFRTVDRLHIETVWLDVYHGGVDPSPHDQHLYIDNVVVARRYIGPIGTRPSTAR